MGKYVIKETQKGWTFQLKAGNGETILASESYVSENNCKNGVESVRTSAPAANIEDQTVAGFAEQKHPKFEVYKDKAGKIRFRLKARNGEIIGASEPYNSKDGCMGGIDSVKKNADSPIA